MRLRRGKRILYILRALPDRLTAANIKEFFMKKIVMVFVISVLTAGAISAQQLPLKDVIKQTAREMEGTIPQRTVIAIINFSSPTRNFSEYVIDELINELLETGKLTLVDRRNLNSIREELNLSVSGDVSDASAISIGKLLGARYIISGTLTKMENYHRFRTRIVNVETGVIQRQITFDLQNDTQVATLLGIEAYEEKTANVRNNWLSASLYGFLNLSPSLNHNENEVYYLYPEIGFGVHYERMLFSFLSVGVHGYVGFMDARTLWGVDGSVHFYPFKKGLFLGAGLGYGFTHEFFDVKYFSPSKGSYQEQTNRVASGFAVTAEIGAKLDPGKAGGFFWQPGLEMRFLFDDPTDIYFKWYIGLGYAF
jgi:TolB-like protein